jgi:hypothetical protein
MPCNGQNKCPLREDIIENCKQLYKKSKMEFVLYLESILFQNERVVELAGQYKNTGSYIKEQKALTELTDYLGLTELV